MSKDKVRWKMVVGLSGSFCAFLIGAGFCSGQEILQYFTNYGLEKAIGVVIINAVLGSWTAAVIMNLGNELNDSLGLNSYKALCGNAIGRFLSFFIPVFTFLTLVIMIAGCGSTFNQLFGLPKWVGGVLLAVATVIIVFLGLTRIIDTIGFIGPTIIVVVSIVSVIVIAKNGINLKEYNDFLVIHADELYLASNSWFMAGVLYALWNVVMCLPFMSAMGSKAQNKKEVLLGAVGGNVLFSIALVFLILAEISEFPKIWDLPIPALTLAQSISPIIGVIYGIVLVFAILTTAVPLMWSTAARMADEHSNKFKLIVICIALLGIFGGMIPFEKLINIILPLIGWVGLIELLCIIWRDINLISIKNGKGELKYFEKVIGKYQKKEYYNHEE